MSNLKRYNMVISPLNICKMTSDLNGKYVKFDDIKVLLKPSHNIRVMSCPRHICGDVCSMSFKNTYCGLNPCSVSART